MNTGRRQFLRNAVFSGLALGAGLPEEKRAGPLFSFATLGCPDWSFERIISFAAASGYQGIEFRGLQREFDITKTKVFGNTSGIIAAKRLVRSNNINIVCLGSSAVLHHTDAVLRKKNFDEVKRFIQLAEQLDCPFVRVFADKYPKEMDKDKAAQWIADGINELARFARGKNVDILLSTHGDIATVGDVQSVMSRVTFCNTGISWDILNMWYANKQSPAEVYPQIKKYIRLVHVKDMRFTNNEETNVLPGRGDVPVFEGIEVLRKDGYKGYYSFVWEKFWYPELEEPEVAFADYINVMKSHFNSKSKQTR